MSFRFKERSDAAEITLHKQMTPKNSSKVMIQEGAVAGFCPSVFIDLISSWFMSRINLRQEIYQKVTITYKKVKTNTTFQQLELMLKGKSEKKISFSTADRQAS